MGKSSELFIRTRQQEIENTKDIPQSLIEEIQTRKPQITINERNKKMDYSNAR